MRDAASSPRRQRLVCAAALVVALTSPSPAPAENFLFDLFGGGERRAPARQAPSFDQRRGESRQQREKASKHSLRRGETRAGKPAAKSAGKPPPEPAKPQEPPPPPYDAQMQRLAEVLGGLSFLRDLCGDGDGDDWRGKMAQLRDADAPAGTRRQRLTAAFNRGFRSYELTYRVCTPNARLVIARYLDEAERLSRDVASRYGNP
jgi:uncharacterized protein (TIGR02301 family)